MLHLAIAAGLVLGLVVGLGAAATGNEWLQAIALGSAPFGIIFMNAIRMVVIPLIVTVIFTNIDVRKDDGDDQWNDNHSNRIHEYDAEGRGAQRDRL